MKIDSGQGSRLALDLNNEIVTLFTRTKANGWQSVGQAELGAGDFDDQIDALRVEALVRAKENEPVLLWLPTEQIVMRDFELAPGSADAARSEALQRIAKETDFSPEELIVALAPDTDGSQTRVLAALQQTVSEAKAYARRWGFANTLVSTRLGGERFGPNGAIFAPPPTIARQAGQAVRRLAVAAAILIAAAGAIYGSYHALQPLLQEPTDIRSSGPALISFSVVVDPMDQALSPLRLVRTGSADSLAIRRIHIPNDDDVRALGGAIYGGHPDRQLPPALTAPSDGARMQVGSAPGLPDRSRPGRLAVVEQPYPSPDAKLILTALDRIRLQGLPRSHNEVTTGPVFRKPETTTAPELHASIAPTEVTAARPQGTLVERPVASARPAITEDDPVPETADKPATNQDAIDPAPQGKPEEPAATGDQPSDDALPTENAPTEMASAPAPRPALPEIAETAAAQAAGAIETTVNADADDGAVETTEIEPAEPPAETVVAIAPVPAAPTTQARAAADAVVPAPEDQAAAEEPEPSVFAALAAPAPFKRPKIFERAPTRPNVRQKSIPAVAIPRTVKAAAKEVGLELDKTSLIGVIDARSGRQALVRMPSGSFRKVSRGDVIDGWRVSSIGREALRLTRRGQDRTLLLVSR